MIILCIYSISYDMLLQKYMYMTVGTRNGDTFNWRLFVTWSTFIAHAHHPCVACAHAPFHTYSTRHRMPPMHLWWFISRWKTASRTGRMSSVIKSKSCPVNTRDYHFKYIGIHCIIVFVLRATAKSYFTLTSCNLLGNYYYRYDRLFIKVYTSMVCYSSWRLLARNANGISKQCRQTDNCWRLFYIIWLLSALVLRFFLILERVQQIG